jgi:hypothetical protein
MRQRRNIRQPGATPLEAEQPQKPLRAEGPAPCRRTGLRVGGPRSGASQSRGRDRFGIIEIGIEAGGIKFLCSI